MSDMSCSSSERLIVPLEDVLLLCSAAPAPASLPPSLRDLLRFLLQRHDLSDATLDCLRPAAVAWLVCLCPALAQLDWTVPDNAPDGAQALHAAARRLLPAGALSLIPLQGPLRQLAHAHADLWEESLRREQTLAGQTARLAARLEEVEPAATELLREQRRGEAAQEEVRQMRSRLRAAEDELAQLRRQVEHLQQAARTAPPAQDAASAPPAEEFGFGSRSADSEGFGF